MEDTIHQAAFWWKARRRNYNVGLVVAGLLAFAAYATIGSTMLQADVNFEVTPFTVFFQGLGYLVMIGVANACYCIGPISERIVRPSNPQRYRIVCYRLGFWFSVLLPFGIPAMLAASALFWPSAVLQSR